MLMPGQSLSYGAVAWNVLMKVSTSAANFVSSSAR